MKKYGIAAFAWSCMVATGAQAMEFTDLYRCSAKLRPVSSADAQSELLADDLMYLLHRDGTLFLYTPYFTGKADLQHDRDGKKIEEKGTFPPGTISFNGSHEMNIRIPYFPDSPGKTSGYYYMTVNDSYLTTYGDPYVKAGKALVRWYQSPHKGPHSATVSGLVRFLPGQAIPMPDFTHYTPPQNPNGITITSVSGQKDSGVIYHELTVEEKLWNKNAADTISPEAMNALRADIAYRLNHMAPEVKAGARAECWGHAGCDYTYTQQQADADHQAHMDAISACKGIAAQ